MVEQRAADAGDGLREALGGQDAERGAGDHHPVEVAGGRGAAGDDLVGPERLGVRHTGVEVVERRTVVEVRCRDLVPGRPQSVHERDHPGRQPARVVEQHDLGHDVSSPPAASFGAPADPTLATGTAVVASADRAPRGGRWRVASLGGRAPLPPT